MSRIAVVYRISPPSPEAESDRDFHRDMARLAEAEAKAARQQAARDAEFSERAAERDTSGAIIFLRWV